MEDMQFSSQGSRVSLQATSKYGAANLKAFLELDFLGNAPTGLNVTTNSNTPRMRLYWGQYRQGAFEFVTGQAWSLLTPNRNGLDRTPPMSLPARWSIRDLQAAMAGHGRCSSGS